MDDKHGVPFRVPRLYAWLIVLGGIGLTGFFDFWVGQDIWFGPLYFLFIGLAAWTLGWREAIATLALAATINIVAHQGMIYPYTEPTSFPNIATRLVPTLAIIGLLGYSRHFSEREWRQARIDSLTGALNRKAFFERTSSIRHAKGWHVLAYADLDGLKRLNDELGHARGDEELTAFAANVRKTIRKRDLFARVGGDEFLIYLAVRDAKAGLEVANRLHQAVNASMSGTDQNLQCSVGALILAPGPRSIDRELRAADALMYEAKQCGSALTVATAREHQESLTTEGRWMLTPVMNDVPQLVSDREFRNSSRDRGGKGSAAADGSASEAA